MQTIRRGLVAGLLAGLVLATLDFVTDGTPGSALPAALHWFGITIADPTISRFAGFFLLLVLGGVFGLIFGALQRERMISISRGHRTRALRIRHPRMRRSQCQASYWRRPSQPEGRRTW